MISLGSSFARQALDDAFLRLMRDRVAAAIASGDVEAFRGEVEELCEARRQAARAIDRNLSR